MNDSNRRQGNTSTLPPEMLIQSLGMPSAAASKSTPVRKRTDLYYNTNNLGRYNYPREFQVDNKSDDYTYRQQQQHRVELDNVSDIAISGIPDGVSPQANEALMPKNSVHRLYIFSDSPLGDQTLATIDSFYGKKRYPILEADKPNAILTSNYPKNNFYMCKGRPSVVSEYVEYRYLQQRHLMSNICYDSESGEIFKLVLPHRPQLVILMPRNFVRTGLKQGYFRFDNNLIVRVFSRFLLSSQFYNDRDNGETTVFSMDDVRLKAIVEKFMGRLGMHKIDSNTTNHIYGYDKFMTIVVGSVANIMLP